MKTVYYHLDRALTNDILRPWKMAKKQKSGGGGYIYILWRIICHSSKPNFGPSLDQKTQGSNRLLASDHLRKTMAKAQLDANLFPLNLPYF